MAHVQSDRVYGVAARERLLHEAGCFALHAAVSESFDAHLKRARESDGSRPTSPKEWIDSSEASSRGDEDQEDGATRSTSEDTPIAGASGPPAPAEDVDAGGGVDVESHAESEVAANDENSLPRDLEQSRQDSSPGERQAKVTAEAETNGTAAHGTAATDSAGAAEAAAAGDETESAATSKGADSSLAARASSEESGNGEDMSGEPIALDSTAEAESDASAGRNAAEVDLSAMSKSTSASEGSETESTSATGEGAEKTIADGAVSLDDAAAEVKSRSPSHRKSESNDAAAAGNPPPAKQEGLEPTALTGTVNVAKAVAPAISAPVVESSSNSTGTPGRNADGAVSALSANGRAAVGRQRAGANGERGADEVAQADRVRFVQRVAGAFRSMGERGGTVRLKLSPPELGALRIEINVRNGQMNARIEADNATTRSLLLDSLPQLRERLAEQGIRVQQFDVNLSDRSAGGSSHEMADQSAFGGQGRGGHHTPRETTQKPAETAGAEPPVVRTPNNSGQLNVIV
ncbi:MAG: flagellar hook-length control protein FliK [Planctomycetota bacterium]